MKRFAEQFNKKASTIRLSAAERRDLSDRLVSYMEYHPLPADLRQEKSVTQPKLGIISEPFLALNIDLTVFRSFAGALALVLVVVVPMLAERSVPGDMLYPVKVEFNEEVRSTLAISPYAQVEWETERLERRLSEARLLASEGKLTDEVEASVVAAVKEHSDKAKESIAKIRETDEDEAALAEITFASALSAQSEALEGQAKKEVPEAEGEDGHSVAILADLMAQESLVADATQAEAKPSYERLLARVETETTKAYELFASVSEVASAEEVSDIERRLGDIERKINEAAILHDGIVVEPSEESVSEVVETEPAVIEEVVITDYASGTEAESSEAQTIEVEEEAEVEVEETPEFIEPTEEVTINPEEAIALLRTVLTDTRKLISFMTNIDVRENVNLEELVPLTLTPDEKIILIKSTLEEVLRLQVEIERRTINEAGAEKFAYGEEKLTTLVDSAKTALANNELDSAREQANEALLVAADLFAMTSADLRLEDVANEPADKASSTEEEVLSE